MNLQKPAWLNGEYRPRRLLLGIVCSLLFMACEYFGVYNEAVIREDEDPTDTEEDRLPIDRTYWNAWFHPQQADEPEHVDKLKPGREYELILDLSPYQYDKAGTESVESSKEFMDYLNQQLDEFTIYVLPVVAGRGLQLLPSAQQARPLKLTMERLRRPRPPRNPGESLLQFSQRVQAGYIKIGVKAVEVGCAAVGLSIWNRALDRPLDHLVRSVSIVGPDGVGQPCPQEEGKALLLQGSLLSLLNQTPDRKADAALHIFEIKVGQEIYSEAVFVDRTPGAPAVHSWRLNAQPSELFSDHNFLNALEEARSQKDYKFVSKKVTNRIFGAEDQKGKAAAKAAQQALKRLTGLSPKPAFFARLVDTRSSSLFLPLGLLNIGSELFGKKVHVLQPLPRETYSQPGQCIASWSMVLPRDLGLGENWKATLESEVTVDGERMITNFFDFIGYAGEPVVPPARPEGLLLLSHHEDGNVWFENDAIYVSFVDDFTREFAPGSVAVLSACSTAKLTAEGDHRALRLLEALNKRNVDAVVISPFNVPPGVGIVLAQAFAKEVTKASRANENPDLAELFSRAAHAAVAEDSPLNSLVTEDAFQEFFIAGNSGLRLCKSPRR